MIERYPTMDRRELRALQRGRVNARQKQIAQDLGLPKGFIQFAARHGVMPEQIRNERLKYQDAR
jgi:hypothetical protein